MKKLVLLFSLSLATTALFAQSVDLRRKIEVSGIAEKEVTPDIINVSISLQEYMDGKKKITIDQLENQLESAVKSAGVPKEDLTINNVSAWQNIYQKKKNPDFLASKQYMIKFHDLNKYNAILSAIDSRGIMSTNIQSYDYSGITELKRELKLQALLAAKEKAEFLLKGINEHLGRPIYISESDNTNYPQPRMLYANKVMASQYTPSDSDIDVTKIKLSFTIQATFEIAP